MNQYLTLWIFIYGSLLQCHYATSPSSEVTPTDSSILNLVIDGSTNTNSDKQLKTTISNSNDSFSLNNVNTESLHSSLANEECKSGDCTKTFFTSSSTDNSSSSASKNPWNLVSTAKSTTQSSVNDETDLESEEITAPLYFPINAYAPNNSVGNNASFYSNDNELDSQINGDNNLLEMHHTLTDKFISNLFSIDNLTITASEPSVMTTEILLNELENSEENSTDVWKMTERHPQIFFYSSNASDTLNVTEYATTPNTIETTVYADNELDFTTYFLDTSNSNDTSDVNLHNEDFDSITYFYQNSTEIPYYDSEALSENDNSSTLVTVNYDVSERSDELKSKNNKVTIDVNSSELDTSSSYGDSTVPALNNSGNNASVYPDYEESIEYEQPKSKISRMIDIIDVRNDTTTSPFVSDVTTSVLTDEEELVTMPTNLNAVTSVSAETPTGNVETTPILIPEKHNILVENEQLNKDSTTENADYSDFMSTFEVPNNDSTESFDSADISERMNNMFNLTREETRAINPTHTPNYASTIDSAYEKSTLTISKEHAEPTEISDFNSHHLQIDHFSTSLDDYTEKNLDVPVSEVIDQNASLFARNTKFEDERTTSTKSQDDSYTVPSVSLNADDVDLNTVQGISTTASNSNNLKEINDKLSTIETNYNFFTYATTAGTKEGSLSEERSITNHTYDVSTKNISEINEMITDKTSVDSLTSTESLDNQSNILTHTSGVSATSLENHTESGFTSTENVNKLTSITDHLPETHSDKTDLVTTKEMLASSTTELPWSSQDITTEDAILHHSETVKPSIPEKDFYENTYHTQDKIFSTTTKKSVTEAPFEITPVTDSKHFETVPISSVHKTDISSSVTATTSSEEFPSTVAETHREGKHIPFSSTLVRRTTSYPIIFNVTARTHSYPPQTDTTEHNLVNLRYNQIKAEELSPAERTNLINAVVKFSDKFSSNDELNERIAVIHLWLLHAVADEYKNATLNLSGTNNTKSDEIEFENLPQILYVLPTPEVFLPNISFTFVVHNKWRNETFPADIILTILNLHAENLKKILVDIEEIHFSQGLLIQKHDLMFVIIEKYGIILLSTCLITVGMIFLLICVVIYYRKKTRHSAHCLTDEKLHRNMQEAMGIDLNPAVIILQEEIREKAALNGNKVCSLDGDEGWLAPINDVPVEDNNAPFVQDTKL